MLSNTIKTITGHNDVGELLADITTILAGYTPDRPTAEYLELRKQSDQTDQFMYLFNRYCGIREVERELGLKEKIEVQTKFAYIEFVKIGEVSRAVPIYSCINSKTKDDLGSVQFYAPWKKFCYYPVSDIVLNGTCMSDIVFFVSQLNNPTVAMHPDHIKKLDEILAADAGMTDGELKFIESVNKQRQRALSQKQAKWLDDIWNKLFQ